VLLRLLECGHHPVVGLDVVQGEEVGALSEEENATAALVDLDALASEPSQAVRVGGGVIDEEVLLVM
jgi:hypothetical protein